MDSVKELEDQTVQAAYVMPSHQFPTGIVMPVKRRQELLSWAGELPGRYLIEDDYDSEFRYEGKTDPRRSRGWIRRVRSCIWGTPFRRLSPHDPCGIHGASGKSAFRIPHKKGRFYSSTVSRVDQRILANFISGDISSAI